MKTALIDKAYPEPSRRALFPAGPVARPEAPGELHHRIASALQVSLEPDLVLSIFAREVRARVPCDGITYANEAEHIYAADGKNGRHQCTYSLTLNGLQLGTLHFTRSRKFREEELVLVEDLLRGFLHPIRNALLYREAQRAATTDALTGLKNRGAFDDRFPRDVERSARYRIPLSLVMIDLDNFKEVNDTHGHVMGDRLLRSIAQMILDTVRKADEAFRYGGDEFVLILPSTGLKGAERVAQRLQRTVRMSAILTEPHPVQSSVSCGVAAYEARETARAFLDRADAALYRAKRSGKDRICLD
jgi:diguanylate cyclase (GGDEF)-like protein